LALNSEDSWGYVALGYATLYKLARAEEAVETLESGLRLDPRSSIGHYLMALSALHAGDCEKALQHADLAASLAPFDLLARGNRAAADNVRSTINFIMSRYQDGIEFARKSIKQCPAQLPAYRLLAFNCAFAGEIQEASAAIKLVKGATPDLEQWIRDDAALWRRREDHRKYFEGFHLADRGR
jgi:tetratricopeptide (TPR) repeat protein